MMKSKDCEGKKKVGPTNVYVCITFPSISSLKDAEYSVASFL